MELDFNAFNEQYEKYEEVFNNLFIKTRDYLAIKADLIVSVTIVDNEFIHKTHPLDSDFSKKVCLRCHCGACCGYSPGGRSGAKISF